MKKTFQISISLLLLVFTLSSCKEKALISTDNTSIITGTVNENQNKPDNSVNTLAPTSEKAATNLPNELFEPTLNIDMKETKIHEYITNYDNNELPCWFDICPGETSWNDASRELKHLNLYFSSQEISKDSIYHGIHGFDIYDDYVMQSLSYIEQEGIVSGTSILVNGYTNMSEFHKIWNRYSPQSILVQYGKPDRIYVYVHDDQGYGSPTTGYNLWLVYDSLNFYVEYNGRTEYKENFSICPRFEYEEDIGVLEIITDSEYSELDLTSTIDGEKRLYSDQMQALNQISNMSIDDLYQDFIHEDGCFDTSLDYWKVD
ncbi:MAG: hypothetical protein JEZ00_17395 [Anaerolineaceae bacterium]|nr:hypothetical protein [Anaerolineaceae bacterium]